MPGHYYKKRKRWIMVGNMINILVLEDRKCSREALVKMISEYGRAGEIYIDSAATFEEAKEYIDSKKTYHGFFIDINLDEEDENNREGIEFAKLLRKNRKYEFTPVIMVTSIASLEMTSFREIHCYQYIVKPYDKQTVEEVIRKIVMHDKVAEEKNIIVKKDGVNYKIKCDAICYVQAISRGVMFKLSREQIKVPYMSIKKLMTILPEDDFIQCHRMYVANKRHIKLLDVVNRVIIMEDGTRLEIGVTYKDKIKEFIKAQQ